MLKESAVESIGEQGLLLPTRIKAALAANDRLKLHLSVVQAAVQHADKPKSGPLDLSHEQAAAQLELVLEAVNRFKELALSSGERTGKSPSLKSPLLFGGGRCGV